MKADIYSLGIIIKEMFRIEKCFDNNYERSLTNRYLDLQNVTSKMLSHNKN